MNNRSQHWRLILLAGLGLCGFASAAVETTTSCATADSSSTVTTCFFDLTNSSPSTPGASDVLTGGLFRVAPADTELGQGFTGVVLPFVRIQEDGNGGTNSGGMIATGYEISAGGGTWAPTVKLGDIPKVTVCDGGASTGANCRQAFEFLLDVSRSVPTAGISLDVFKLFVAWNGHHDPRGASVSGWSNTAESPDTNTAQQARRPREANDAGWSDSESSDAQGRHRAAQAGDGRTSRDANRPRPAAPLRVQRPGKLDSGDEWAPGAGGLPGQTPTPATALLLGIGLAGLVLVRRNAAKRDRMLRA